MNAGDINNWQGVQGEVLHRIQSRQWKPGELIPNEVDLAQEFGCARATVNRALRAVAEQGLIDRRRKAGTRVATHPVRRATLKIPVIRHEIERLGQAYSYQLILSESKVPPSSIRLRMNIEDRVGLMHLQAVHFADQTPYAFEDRWINPSSLSGIEDVDFKQMNANEWLVQNAPFSHGDISFSATPATETDAEILNSDAGQALFVIERTTWNEMKAVTCVKLLFAPGYRMHTNI